jgi:hypothetical protein
MVCVADDDVAASGVAEARVFVEFGVAEVGVAEVATSGIAADDCFGAKESWCLCIMMRSYKNCDNNKNYKLE